MNTKKHFAAIIILFSSTVAFAETPSSTQTVLPLQFNSGNPAPYGMPSTTINIAGKNLPILLDTGEKKAGVVLSLNAIKGLPIKFTGQEECFQAFDGKHCEQVFIIPQVKIGSFTVDNVKGRLMTQLWGGNNAGFKATEASNNGLIGFQLLSQFNVLLDYPHAQMILTKPGNKPIDYDISNWTVIPFNGHLQSALLLNGRPLTVSWDTGSIPSVISKTMAANFKAAPCPGNAPYSKINCSSIAPTSFITLNNTPLPKTWFQITDIPTEAPFDALMGSNFYQENLVYFDFTNSLIYVKHATK